jgi:tripartite-type tricarboxylate transporter receptor subunit TctC
MHCKGARFGNEEMRHVTEAGASCHQRLAIDLRERDLEKRFTRLAALVLLAAACGGVLAQDYPGRSVRLVVTSPVGSTPDVLARAIAARLSDRWPHPMVVEQKLGAGGNIGYEHVARSPADGYHLVLAGNSLLINPSLYKNLPYDALKDLVPITRVASSQNVLVAHPSVEARTVAELVALAKKMPGKLTYGSAGTGTPLHLAGEMFKLQNGVQIVHVPYKGSRFAANDLLAGRIHLTFSGVVSFIPHLKSGKLRAIAVTGATRSPLMPNVPTFAQAGMPDYDIEVWFGLYGPSGMPAPIVARLNDEFAVVMAEPALRSKMNGLGMALPDRKQSPEQFAGAVRSELAKMAALVKASGARVD